MSNARGSAKRTWLLASLGLLLGACASLQPVELPPEYTAPASHAALWEQLESLRDDDWQAPLDAGGEALDWRLRAIDSATQSIDLQTFLWSFDRVGAMILHHLIVAADRGVLVKILIDDTFLAGEEEMLLQLAEHTNIEYRVFNPYKRRSDSLITRQLLNLAEFHRLDHRMHNKSMIIDNRVAIVGGRNLADEYFGLAADANFRDMELLIGGPSVAGVSAAFDEYWNDEWSIPIEMLSHIEPSPVSLHEAQQVVDDHGHVHREETPDERSDRWRTLVKGAHSGNVRLYADVPPEGNPADAAGAPVQVANELLEIFDTADEEVLILSAYLIPSLALEGAIERAVNRGVNVRILTNSIQSNNHLAAHSVYRNHIHELMRGGADLHEVRIDARRRDRYFFPPTDQKSMALHAKALIIDRDKVFIGSANLDPRSLRINTEMGLLVESESLNAAIRAQVEPDFLAVNAWHLQFDERGDVMWVSDSTTLRNQPAASFMQRIEDWLFAHLPIEAEL
jgi:putative cardiolipin synthase